MAGRVYKHCSTYRLWTASVQRRSRACQECQRGWKHWFHLQDTISSTLSSRTHSGSCPDRSQFVALTWNVNSSMEGTAPPTPRIPGLFPTWSAKDSAGKIIVTNWFHSFLSMRQLYALTLKGLLHYQWGFFLLFVSFAIPVAWFQ